MGDEDEHDLWYVKHKPFADIGTKDSIPYLLPLIDHKKTGCFSNCIKQAIMVLSGKSELTTFY